MSVSIQNFTRRPVASRALFTRIANDVLPSWEISLVFVGAKRARTLNQKLRNKSYVPNVLSYALGAKSGEIFICLEEAHRQCASYEMSERTFVTYLFIHGLLHVQGRAHGATMENSEQKLLAKYAQSSMRPLPHVTTNRNRNRHRHVPSQNGSRRGTHR
ncbi:MAG: hypothetical protein JWN18_184 [Parcubacteria group bacterium]|nr:hypothetical protein [Parcubacteria group bacterium]